MPAEHPGDGSSDRLPPRASWRSWLGVAGTALGLLVVSEAVWLWQTWPVRELLYPSHTTLPAPPVHPR